MATSIFQGNSTAFEILQTTSPLLILEGQALRLLCAADSNPPAALSWFRGSPALNASPISSTAILELPRVGTAEEGELTCQARHPLGSPSVSLSLSESRTPGCWGGDLSPPDSPELLGPSCSWEEEGLHCSCSSRAQAAPSLCWWQGERLLEGNLSNASFKVTFSSAGPWANSSLSLSKGLSSILRPSCKSRNVHEAQSTTVLLLPGSLAQDKDHWVTVQRYEMVQEGLCVFVLCTVICCRCFLFLPSDLWGAATLLALVLTLLMGAGFLLSYDLTCIYYTQDST
ncbi:sialic acid-binding Ig-like lectin 5 [Hipposideros larvatus]